MLSIVQLSLPPDQCGHANRGGDLVTSMRSVSRGSRTNSLSAATRGLRLEAIVAQEGAVEKCYAMTGDTIARTSVDVSCRVHAVVWAH
jgi:hypothetical protein